MANQLIRGPAPRITIDVDLRGLARRIAVYTQDLSVDPFEKYELFNSAQDPSGQYYFNSVNDGTGPKLGKQSFAVGMYSSGKIDNRGRKVPESGRLVHPNITGGNPAHHMRERTVRLIRAYFRGRVKSAVRNKSEFKPVMSPEGMSLITYGTSSSGRIVAIPLRTERVSALETTRTVTVPGLRTIKTGSIALFDPKGLGSYSTTANFKLTQSKIRGGILNPLPGKDFFESVMEDTMDFAVARIRSFTPVLQAQYYSEGYTTEPGTLKNSYGWRKKGQGGGHSWRTTGTYEHGHAATYKLIGKPQTKTGELRYDETYSRIKSGTIKKTKRKGPSFNWSRPTSGRFKNRP